MCTMVPVVIAQECRDCQAGVITPTCPLPGHCGVAPAPGQYWCTGCRHAQVTDQCPDPGRCGYHALPGRPNCTSCMDGYVTSGCPFPHQCGHQAACHHCIANTPTVNCPAPALCMHDISGNGGSVSITLTNDLESGDMNPDDCMMWMLFIVTKDVYDTPAPAPARALHKLTLSINRHVFYSMNGISKPLLNGLVVSLLFGYVSVFMAYMIDHPVCRARGPSSTMRSTNRPSAYSVNG
jgi:hypothetical protein